LGENVTFSKRDKWLQNVTNVVGGGYIAAKSQRFDGGGDKGLGQKLEARG
jgi:hypothetical protein